MNDHLTSVAQGPSIEQEVMGKFAVALLVMTLGMAVGAMFVPAFVAVWMPWVCLGMLIVALVLRWNQTREEGRFKLSMPFVYVFAALEGVGIYPIIMTYAQSVGANLVLGAVALTFLIFFGLATYARTTERDFLRFGPMLFVALWVLIGASVLGWFVDATLFQVMLCAAGIFVFSGYVLYDIQTMRSGMLDEEDVPLLVLNLFLDFINILLYVLRLLGIFSAGKD